MMNKLFSKFRCVLLSGNTVVSTIVLTLSACSFNFGLGVNDHNVEASYQVHPIDLSLTLIEGNEDREDAVAWNKAISILPNDLLKKYVTKYEVFTDGIEDSLASVENTDADGRKWLFSIDYEDATKPNSEEFVTTLIHEFFHIISLNSEQVDRKFASCSQYKITEGCTKESSYINQYYKQFWQSPIYQDYQHSLKTLQIYEEEDAIADFYDKHPDDFVNEYSATNPVEDFAETFAYFVLSDKVANPTTIKDKKLNFFYQYPELVEIRDHIRSRTDIRK